MDKWMTEEPQIKVADFLGGLLVSLGMILFVTVLHLLAINEFNGTGQVINRMFIIFLVITIFLILMGAVYVLFQLLRWLAYLTYTPRWMKEQDKEARQR